MNITVAVDDIGAAEWAARFIARRLTGAVRRRGRASLAVSGGVTPAVMFDHLVGLGVDWSQIDLFQVDERLAPDGSVDRNATQLMAHLVDPLRLSARSVHLMPVGAARARAAATRYAERLAAVGRLDVVHLGIGDDGHTASWPPGDPVADSTASVAFSQQYRGTVRMTLTPPVVNGARCRVVLATGATKAWAVQQWLLGDRALPIQRVHRSGTELVLDHAAATLVNH